MLKAGIPLPAENIYQATLSPVEVWVSTCDVTTDGNIAAGLVNWNTEGDILDQYETLTACLCIRTIILAFKRGKT